MANSGLIQWIILLIVACVVNYLTSYLLIRTASELKLKNFEKISGVILGNNKIFLDIIQIFMLLGINISCLLTFSNFITNIFNYPLLSGLRIPLFSSKNTLFWIVTSGIFITPLMIRTQSSGQDFFSFTQFFSVIFLAIYSFYQFINSDTKLQLSSLPLFNLSNIPQCFSVLLFGFMYQQGILEIYQQLNRNKQHAIIQIIFLSSIQLFVIYLFIAVFGYLAFSSTKAIHNSSILDFERDSSVFYLFVNLFISLSVILSTVGIQIQYKGMIQEYFDQMNYKIARDIKIKSVVILQVFSVLIASMMQLNKIKFIDAIDTVSTFISPLISVYLPILFYIQVKKKYKLLTLIFFLAALNFYVIL